MEQKPEQDNPFIPDDIEMSLQNRKKRSEWIRRNITHRTLEIVLTAIASIASLSATIISCYSLRSTNESLELTRQANKQSDSLSKIAMEYNKQLTDATTTAANATTKSSESSQKAAEAFSTFAKASTENLQYSKKTIDIQVNTLNEQRKQYVLNNEPFLQIEIDCATGPIIQEGNWPTEIRYKLVNFGKYPIKILNGHIEFFIDSNSRQKYRTPYSPHPINYFMTHEGFSDTYKTLFHADNKPDPNEIKIAEDIISYRAYLFFVGYYNYVNLATNEIITYQFLARITNSYPYYYYIHNKNIKTKEYLKSEDLYTE